MNQTVSGYEVTVDREVYPPHYAGLLHTHPGPGSFCVIEGQMTVEVRGQPAVSLRPGECWPEQAGIIHRPVNNSDQQAVVVFYLLAQAGQPRIAPNG